MEHLATLEDSIAGQPVHFSPSRPLSFPLPQPHSFLPPSGSSPFLSRPPTLHHPHQQHHHGVPPPHMTFVPPPSTPDKLQGEPWDFHSPTPGALYGAIGSGLPSNAATQPFSQSFSIQAPPTAPPSSSGRAHGIGEVWSKPSSGGVAPFSSAPPPILSVSQYSGTSKLLIWRCPL